MLRRILIYLIILLPISIFGQLQGYHSSDIWMKFTDALAFDLKMNPVKTERTHFHFRFWTIGQAIDIWKDNTDSLRGEIINYARDYDEMNLGKRNFYSTRLQVPYKSVFAVYNMIGSSGIIDLPSGDAVNKWRNDLSGFTYVVEYADTSGYLFKSYFDPSGQGSLKVGKEIRSFISKLDQLLDLEKCYMTFAPTIPFRCYTKGTARVYCRKK